VRANALLLFHLSNMRQSSLSELLPGAADSLINLTKS
jgi:hypothetical protein